MKKTTAASASAPLVVLAVVLINFVTMPAMEYHGDARAVRMQAIAILNQGRLAVPEAVATPFGPRGNYFYQTNDGAWYPKFGILNTFIYLPFLALEKAMKGHVAYNNEHALVLNLLNLFAAAGAAFYLFRLARCYTKADWVSGLFVFVSIYCTFWWHYLRAQTFEAYMVPMVLGFFYHFVSRPNESTSRSRHFLVSGAFLGALCLCKTVFVVFIPLAVLFLLKRNWSPGDHVERKRGLVMFFAPVALALTLLALSDWYRFGSVFNTGYTQWAAENRLFDGNVLTGLRGYLFGAQTSVFLNFPVLFFALPFWPAFLKRNRNDGLLAMSLGVVFVLIHAARSNWSGAVSYGPRYVLPVAPLLALPFIDFLEWSRGIARSLPRWSVATATGVVLAVSFVLQLAVNSLPFYFEPGLALAMDSAGEATALDYLNSRPEGKVALDFLLYTYGWPSRLNAVAGQLSADGFAQLEALKATTRFNYYWERRLIDSSLER